MGGPPDAARPVGCDGDEAVAIGDVGLEVPGGVGLEVGLALVGRPHGEHLAVTGADHGPFGVVEVEGLPVAGRVLGQVGQVLRRHRPQGLGVDDAQGAALAGGAERDEKTGRGLLEPAAPLEAEPRRVDLGLVAERSRTVCRLAGGAVGVGRDLLGRHRVGRRRATDVRRTGPRARGRRDRQPAVRDDHDQEADGRGGRGRPGHDATADVGAVLDPPADPRDRQQRGGEDQDHGPQRDPQQQERADQPDHRATLGESHPSHREAHRGPPRCVRHTVSRRPVGAVARSG